jgi:hypothetical protein
VLKSQAVLFSSLTMSSCDPLEKHETLNQGARGRGQHWALPLDFIDVYTSTAMIRLSGQGVHVKPWLLLS